MFVLSVALTTAPISVYAQHAVVFTENGDTLTETLDGNPIGIWLLVAPNQWANRDGLFADGSLVAGLISFTEPESPPVTYNNFVLNHVFSDALTALGTITPNGVPTVNQYGILSGGNPIVATVEFRDLGEGLATVPDASPSLSLALIACIALFGAHRKSAANSASAP